MQGSIPCPVYYQTVESFKMKTIEMEIALLEHLNVRQNIIVPNVSWGIAELNYECDLVKLSKNNCATEIEIKISKSDLYKDKKKRHNHHSHLFKYFYFAVPEKLEQVALEEIPEHAGLFVITKQDKYYRVREVKKPKLNKHHTKWNNKQRQKLAELGTMRILGLKQALVGKE